LLWVSIVDLFLPFQKEREFAAEQSARVIDAYRTLNNALSRAIYIVSI